MEREGSGFKKIMEDYTAEVAHNTAKVMPKFYSAVGCFVVTLPRLARGTQGDAQGVAQGVTQGGTQGGIQGGTQGLSEGIKAMVRKNPKITAKELSSATGVPLRTLRRHLAKLPNVRYVGHGYSGDWVVD